MEDNHIPASALVIFAHPDDAEFSTAGTVAAWTEAGCQVTYVLCTDGNAGSHVPGMTRAKLSEIRREEQRAACAVLGVKDVIFLGYDDGQLQATLELRRDLVREIRRLKPEAVVTGDPTRVFSGERYINHPDHRAAAQAALDATAPASEMPLLWPELGAPHRVLRIYIQGNDQPNTWIDISQTIDTKIAALRKHVSQVGDHDPTERIKGWGAQVGKEKDLCYAEAYRLFVFEARDGH